MASKAEQPQLDDAVKAAREKLKARFGDKVRIGGKGKPAAPPTPAPPLIQTGTQRRTHKVMHKTAATDDTALIKIMKRYSRPEG